MRCNACWRELEGRAVATSCGHLLCTEDASKILSTDGACPICDQVLSKSLMKPVDINPTEEWINMVMAAITPQTLMKSAYRSVMFFIGQRDLEMQAKMNKMVGQCRAKCEAMQEKFSEKWEQIYTAYQKMSKRCQALEQEVENLSKDKQELQEKFSEKCRQKRKLDEMYDQARHEIDSMKRTAIQPANHFYPGPEPDLFSNQPTRMDNRDSIRTDWLVRTPDTPGLKEDMWPRQNSSNSTFDMSGGSPVKQSAIPIETGHRRPVAHPSYNVNRGPGVGNAFHGGTGTGTGPSNPSMTLRNLILSPIKRPQLSRSRPQLFTM